MISIARRMGVGYAVISAVCLILVGWLTYHEFVEEPREFAAQGFPGIHHDVNAELTTVIFLAAVPVMLGFGWWWFCRVMSPLKTLLAAVEKVDVHNLQQTLPVSHRDDEVDKLSAAFGAMARRLDDSFSRIKEFTLRASHELKTPLTVMSAHLETALREQKDMHPQKAAWIDDQIELQLDEVRRLAKIVDSLTLLTKADAGLVQLEHHPVQMAEIVEEAFEDAQILAKPHAVTVWMGKCDGNLIIGDRHRLRQLLLILTDNATKYNRPGGTIAISLTHSDGYAEFKITNTGEDVSQTVLDNAFDRFARGGNVQGRIDGCGLGLTIAQWIVHAHRGNIRLYAEGGGWTSAVVHLPATRGDSRSSVRRRIVAAKAAEDVGL